MNLLVSTELQKVTSARIGKPGHPLGARPAVGHLPMSSWWSKCLFLRLGQVKLEKTTRSHFHKGSTPAGRQVKVVSNIVDEGKVLE